jgi:PAS domain-containing protein
MAPEQVRGLHELVGPRSDVYAVGAMLYHLLTGCMPYAHEGDSVSPQMVLARSYRGRPRALEKLAPDVSPELAAICHKAMSRDPLERYADMQDLGRDLQAYIENHVVRAYRTGALAELNKWCLRNKTIAITCTLAIALMVATLAISFASHGGDWRRLVSGGRAPTPASEYLGSWEWDSSTDVVTWRGGGAQLWGTGAGAGPTTLEDLLARLERPDRRRLREALRDSLASGAPFAIAHALRTAAGELRRVETRGTVVTGADGRPDRVVVVCAMLD